MTWTVRDAERDRNTINAIEAHDDRSAAILAAAYLEDRLMSTIEARLVPDAKIRKKFFTGMGPLASFSAKIDLAYLMGTFDQKIAGMLHVIRQIRNEFAHNLEALSFNTPQIIEFCKRLFDVEFFQGFIACNATAFKDEPDLLELLSVFDPMVNVPNTPRNAYMNTIKTLLLIMELSKAAALMKDTDKLVLVRGKTP
jgi:hypothetical protein